MNIILIFPGFILACLVVLLYEYKIGLLRKQRNNVHFYVARDSNGPLWLYIGKPIRGEIIFTPCREKGGLYMGRNIELKKYGLNEHDYDSLRWEDEPVEVFINMED